MATCSTCGKDYVAEAGYWARLETRWGPQELHFCSQGCIILDPDIGPRYTAHLTRDARRSRQSKKASDA